ncbi:zinc finger protein 395-like isoform X2 [Styela clava]
MMLSQNPPGLKPVLGSRVAVPVNADYPYYVAATVQAIWKDLRGNEYVTVKYDDNHKGECLLSQVVGNGFKSIHDIKLHKHQKVFTVHNGREVVGVVEDHSGGLIRVRLSEVDVICKHEEDVRLTESRYSPRLQDHNHQVDYRKIASENASPNHGKKRPVSASIEVPKVSRARKSSAEPSMDELMAAMVLSSLSSSPVFHNARSPSMRKDGSPHSFGSSGVGSWGQDSQMSPIRGEHVPQAAGHSVIKSSLETPERSQSVIQHTQSIGNSPSSTGDPIEVDTSSAMDTSIPKDEDYNSAQGVIPPGHSTPAPFQTGSPRLQYHSPGSSSPAQNPNFLVNPGAKLESVKEEPNGGEEDRPRPSSVPQPHIFYIPSLIPSVMPGRPEYMLQMQTVSTPPPPLAPADERSYRKIGSFPPQPQFQAEVKAPSSNNTYVCIGSAPPTYYTLPVMRAPSPLAARNEPASVIDTPYQGSKLVGPSHSVRMPVIKSPAQPINISGIDAFSWHNTLGDPRSYSPKPSLFMQRQHLHQAASPKMSPKTMTTGRKVRGDGKKCRKVYGMENRDMWCTACRWKKACQRFPD